MVKDLIACDFTKRESKILANTLTQQDQMLTYRQREIARLQEEIVKRDDLLANKDDLIDLARQKEVELNKQLRTEKRKKVANKWLYLGLGAVGGYFITKL